MNPPMNSPSPPQLSPAVLARLRLAVMLLVSLALHIVLISALQFGAIERGSRTPAVVIEARLASDTAAEQPVLLKAIDKPVKSRVQDWAPPPVTAAPPQAAPAPAAAEPYRPGMSKEAAGVTTVDAPLPADATYYHARDVDEHPLLVAGGRPVYPQAASEANTKGEVLVLFMLNENGTVDEASVIEAKPANQGFEQAVIDWLKQARFKPAIRKGRTVKSRVVYRVQFDP